MDTQEKMKLTPKQAEILKIIEDQIEKTGLAPTYRDIARACGYDAVGTVQDHVRALMKKGYLKKDPRIARGLKLVHQEMQRTFSRNIPILGTVPAGSPLELLEGLHTPENILGSLSIPAQWKGQLFALRVRGDSMIEAGILENDLVVIQSQPDAENGEIVVASIDGEATVKFLEKKNQKIQLLPANPRYSPIVLSPRSDDRKIQIIGKVISVQRFYKN